ncbi:IclR family transcriptional regulator [Haematobacter genomosp. 1]|uniref:IclR family transcriptional regulator n=1 Tax=Haematobacter genomosp. 1 TaxID=366618 RepID=A0A212ADR2_9RHOB|nr:IclR family transcriptional regulator [Haematobacter genomosp. 1]OWJ79375.1 IclR family transcriptional regulator [Haematobacter genomosp. 1]
MSSVVEKSLAIIEGLAEHPAGLSVSHIAGMTGQPVSGVHRTLHELIRLGYVRQIADGGDYTLSIKLAALGLGFMRRAGINDVVQPILDRLAAESGELIRLSVIDNSALTWVAVAQGATTGLRYDPGQEQGVVVHLASSAGGRAWLAAMRDEEALEHVSAQGFGRDDGPAKPIGIPELLAILKETRARGYSVAVSTYILGMAAMAVTVRYADTDRVLGCLSIAGPSVRMTDTRMAELAPLLQSAATELGMAAPASEYFALPARRAGPKVA